MRKWLKRIRGAVGMGLTWAAAWFGVGALIEVVTMVLGISSNIAVLELAAAFAIMGFVGGAAFSTVLAVTEGRRRFDEMSLPRFAAWGAVGSFLLALPLLLLAWDPLALDGLFGIGGVVALMGAGSAAGSLALARRADDRELLDSGLRPSVLPVDLRRREGQGKPVPPGEDL